MQNWALQLFFNFFPNKKLIFGLFIEFNWSGGL